MIINIDVSRREMDEVDLGVATLEEILWGVIGEHIDPEENLNVELNINLFD